MKIVTKFRIGLRKKALFFGSEDESPDINSLPNDCW